MSEEVETSPRFSSTRVRANNCEELVALIDRAVSAKPCEEWLSLCRDRGLICASVNRVEDIAGDVQIAANGYIVDVDHQMLGPMKTVGFPISFSRVQQKVGAAAPELGQHTEEVLIEGGYSWDEILELRDKGII